MFIGSVRHKGLRRFIETDDPSGLPAASLTKIRDMLSFLQAMTSDEELRQVPSWRAHRLTGNRRGTWALHVTKNWRLTFLIDQVAIEIIDLDYEDYH